VIKTVQRKGAETQKRNEETEIDSVFFASLRLGVFALNLEKLMRTDALHKLLALNLPNLSNLRL